MKYKLLLIAWLLPEAPLIGWVNGKYHNHIQLNNNK